MQVRVLGPIEVRDGARPLELGGIKQRTLLALLLVAGGSALPIDRLIDQLWGDEPPAKVMASVQSYVANLRRELEPHRPPRTRPTMLVTRGAGYELLLPPGSVDADRFVALVHQANAARPDEAIAVVDGALALWRGAAYHGLAATATAVTAEAARLTELRWTAVEYRWQLESDLGAHHRAVGELEKVVAEQPFRERAWGLLAIAHYRAQRQGEALSTLRRARALLADRLGVDPGPALRAVEAAVLAQDDGTLLAAGGRQPDAFDGATVAVIPVPASPPADTSGAMEGDQLVGRNPDLAAIDAAVRDAADGHGRLLLITGPAGIGKSLLAETAVGAAAAGGATTVRGAWDAEGDAPPLWAWSEVVCGLRSGPPNPISDGRDDGLDDDLAPLGARAAGARSGTAGLDRPVDTGSAVFRLATAMIALLGDAGRMSARPIVILLEDLQWADADSCRLLRRIAAALPKLPVALLITIRDPELVDDGPFTQTMAALARCRPTRIALSGLAPDALAEFAERRCGIRPDQRVIDIIAERTDGNPFAAGELLDLLVARGAVTDPAAAADTTVPDGVIDMVRGRLQVLGPDALQLLEAASVMGRHFSVDVLRQAIGLPPDRLDKAIDDARQAGLIVTPRERQRFSHALISETIYQRLAPAGRAGWHERIGDAMLELRATGDEHAAELARHFRASEPHRAPDAVRWCCRAAEVAAARAADEEAARWYAAADEAAGNPATAWSQHYRIQLGLATAHRRLGRERQAWQAVRSAAELALAAGEPVAAAEALVVMTLETIWIWRDYGTYLPTAVELFTRVLQALPADRDMLRARLSGALAVETYYLPDDPGRSVALATDAIRIARRVGTPEELLDALLLAHAALERPELAELRLAVVTEAVALAERLGDRTRSARALCSRGCDRVGLGRIAEGRADLGRAWELAEQQGAVPVMVVIGWARALLTTISGDFAAGAAADVRTADFYRLVEMTGADLSVLHDWTRGWLQGRPHTVEPLLRNAVASTPSTGLRELQALTLAISGRLQEARMVVGPWSEQQSPPADYLWLPLMVGRARLWSALGDRKAIAELRGRLEPYAGQLVFGGTGVIYLGLVDEALGALAAAAGEFDAAVDHLRHCVDRYQAVGLRPSVVFAASLLAEVLRQRGLSADRDEAATLEQRARELAIELDIDLPVPAARSAGD
ncbi:BTAD domain-containing putative transcriptional regulator [Nakamurella lactea]|uniref:BTAD domain-containing putative transcriptional regulator n=1 Tax=Nakamurella lactea TaxID=459515 RepID=UPI001377EC70|nr:BTAD domain-containing putative transcriptional regulator [Nakamurella lactea]